MDKQPLFEARQIDLRKKSPQPRHNGSPFAQAKRLGTTPKKFTLRVRHDSLPEGRIMMALRHHSPPAILRAGSKPQEDLRKPKMRKRKKPGCKPSEKDVRVKEIKLEKESSLSDGPEFSATVQEEVVPEEIETHQQKQFATHSPRLPAKPPAPRTNLRRDTFLADVQDQEGNCFQRINKGTKSLVHDQRHTQSSRLQETDQEYDKPSVKHEEDPKLAYPPPKSKHQFVSNFQKLAQNTLPNDASISSVGLHTEQVDERKDKYLHHIYAEMPDKLSVNLQYHSKVNFLEEESKSQGSVSNRYLSKKDGSQFNHYSSLKFLRDEAVKFPILATHQPNVQLISNQKVLDGQPFRPIDDMSSIASFSHPSERESELMSDMEHNPDLKEPTSSERQVTIALSEEHLLATQRCRSYRHGIGIRRPYSSFSLLPGSQRPRTPLLKDMTSVISALELVKKTESEKERERRKTGYRPKFDIDIIRNIDNIGLNFWMHKQAIWLGNLPEHIRKELEGDLLKSTLNVFEPAIFAKALFDLHKKELRRCNSFDAFNHVKKMTLKDVYPFSTIEAIRNDKSGNSLFSVNMRKGRKFRWKVHASFDNNMIKAVRNDVETFMTQMKLKGYIVRRVPSAEICPKDHERRRLLRSKQRVLMKSLEDHFNNVIRRDERRRNYQMTCLNTSGDIGKKYSRYSKKLSLLKKSGTPHSRRGNVFKPSSANPNFSTNSNFMKMSSQEREKMLKIEFSRDAKSQERKTELEGTVVMGDDVDEDEQIAKELKKAMPMKKKKIKKLAIKKKLGDRNISPISGVQNGKPIVKSISDLRRMNYNLTMARNCVIGKENINQSLDVVRKNIFFMTKLKSKNDLIRKDIEKQLTKEHRKKTREENQAIVPDPEFIPQVMSECSSGTQRHRKMKSAVTRGMDHVYSFGSLSLGINTAGFPHQGGPMNHSNSQHAQTIEVHDPETTMKVQKFLSQIQSPSHQALSNIDSAGNDSVTNPIKDDTPMNLRHRVRTLKPSAFKMTTSSPQDFGSSEFMFGKQSTQPMTSGTKTAFTSHIKPSRKKTVDQDVRNSRIFVPEPAASPLGVCFQESYERPFAQQFVQTRQSKIMDDMREKHLSNKFYLLPKDQQLASTSMTIAQKKELHQVKSMTAAQLNDLKERKLGKIKANYRIKQMKSAGHRRNYPGLNPQKNNDLLVQYLQFEESAGGHSSVEVNPEREVRLIPQDRQMISEGLQVQDGSANLQEMQRSDSNGWGNSLITIQENTPLQLQQQLVLQARLPGHLQHKSPEGYNTYVGGHTDDGTLIPSQEESGIWQITQPLNHTLNQDSSVSITGHTMAGAIPSSGFPFTQNGSVIFHQDAGSYIYPSSQISPMHSQAQNDPGQFQTDHGDDYKMSDIILASSAEPYTENPSHIKNHSQNSRQSTANQQIGGRRVFTTKSSGSGSAKPHGHFSSQNPGGGPHNSNMMVHHQDPRKGLTVSGQSQAYMTQKVQNQDTSNSQGFLDLPRRSNNQLVEVREENLQTFSQEDDFYSQQHPVKTSKSSTHARGPPSQIPLDSILHQSQTKTDHVSQSDSSKNIIIKPMKVTGNNREETPMVNYDVQDCDNTFSPIAYGSVEIPPSGLSPYSPPVLSPSQRQSLENEIRFRQLQNERSFVSQEKSSSMVRTYLANAHAPQPVAQGASVRAAKVRRTISPVDQPISTGTGEIDQSFDLNNVDIVLEKSKDPDLQRILGRRTYLSKTKQQIDKDLSIYSQSLNFKTKSPNDFHEPLNNPQAVYHPQMSDNKTKKWRRVKKQGGNQAATIDVQPSPEANTLWDKAGSLLSRDRKMHQMKKPQVVLKKKTLKKPVKKSNDDINFQEFYRFIGGQMPHFNAMSSESTGRQVKSSSRLGTSKRNSSRLTKRQTSHLSPPAWEVESRPQAEKEDDDLAQAVMMEKTEVTEEAVIISGDTSVVEAKY